MNGAQFAIHLWLWRPVVWTLVTRASNKYDTTAKTIPDITNNYERPNKRQYGTFIFLLMWPC
jgi:hypothetical protein